MPNRDGFEPGQSLTFAEVMHVMRAKRPGPSSVPDAPADIDAMGKAEVRGLLEAHGAEIPQGAKVADMRAALKRVMFMEGDNGDV